MRRMILSLLIATSLFSAEVIYDGARVHYQSYGTGTDAVVFIHGWSCDLTFWRGQAPIYEKHRSLLVDLPGHGRSDKPEVPYTVERLARGVEAVMRNAGVERAVLVGHSMGGPVAVTFLRLFPSMTKAVVMVDAFIPTAPKDEAEKAKAAQAKPPTTSFRGPDYKEAARKLIENMFTDKTTPAQREEILSKMLAAPQHVMSTAGSKFEPIKSGETFDVPVLMIQKARSVNREYEAKLRTVFPKLQFEEWEGSGHFLMIEDPDRFNRVLEGFLERTKSGTSKTSLEAFHPASPKLHFQAPRPIGLQLLTQPAE